MIFSNKRKHLEQQIIYLFRDRPIDVQKPQFSLRWTYIFAQSAHRLNKTGYAVTLYATSNKTSLQFSIGPQQRKFRLSLDWDDDNQPMAVVEFLQFDPDYIINVLRPVFAKGKTLCDFTRYGANAYYHPLTFAEKEAVSFLYKTVKTLFIAINKP